MATFSISQDRHTVTLTTSDIELAFSREDGGLRSLRRHGAPNVLGYGAPCPSVDVQVNTDSTWLAGHLFVRYLNHRIEERQDAVELVIVIGVGSLMLYDRYRISGALIARRISVVNVSDDPVQLWRVRLLLPWARVGALDTCRFEAPGNDVRAHVPLATVAAERHGAPSQRAFAPRARAGQALEPAPLYAPGLLALHDPLINETLLCWYYSEADVAQPLVDGNGAAVTLAHELDLADWLGTGVAISGGTQYIMLLSGTWADTLAAFRSVLASIGVRPAPQHPPWTHAAVIYETHPLTFGGFAGLAAQIPRLRALGVNTICMLPIWPFDAEPARQRAAEPFTGDPYTLRDYEQIDPALGTPDELRDFVQQAHAADMRVVIDLPVVGCTRHSRYVDEFPDWFCRDETGEIAGLPGSAALVCFDWANQELQAYVLAQAIAYARAFAIDGYRLVIERQVVPNWSRHVAARASGAMGVLQFAERLRNDLQVTRCEAVLVSSAGGPLGVSTADIILDELAHQHLSHMVLHRTSPREFGAWLSEHLAVASAETARIGFTESYQTRLLNPLADGLRGSPISRVWFAGLVICGFVPLLHAGQEQHDESFLRNLLRARTEQPALRRGQAFYNWVASSAEDVFVVARQADGAWLLGVLNVGPHRQDVEFTLPVGAMNLDAERYVLHEVFRQQTWDQSGQTDWTRDQLAALTLTLDPFSGYCFALQPAPAEVREQAAHQQNGADDVDGDAANAVVVAATDGA